MSIARAHSSSPQVPDWDDIPFDVACPRCGGALRGCTAALCPECALDLDWAILVPVEELKCPGCHYLLRGLRSTNCPECGRAFTWQQALDHFRVQRSRLFEHMWRTRFVGSLLHSIRRSMRPVRLWTSLNLHDVLSVPALAWLGVLAGALFLVSMAGAFAAIELVDCLMRWRWVFYGGGIETMLGIWIPIIPVWSAASLGALLLLRQSMQRCRLRSGHIMRVWAYAVMGPTLVMPLIVGLGGVIMEVVATLVRVRISFETMITVASIPLFVALTIICRSIWVAYRDYLKMPHALAVALSCQTAAVLATLVFFLVFQFNGSIVFWITRYADTFFN